MAPPSLREGRIPPRAWSPIVWEDAVFGDYPEPFFRGGCVSEARCLGVSGAFFLLACVFFWYTARMSASPPEGQPNPGAKPKICVDCNTECGRRPRTRDAQGRYHCQACVERLAGEKARRKPELDAAAGDDQAIGGGEDLDLGQGGDDAKMFDPIPLDIEPLPEGAMGGAGGVGGILADASGIRPCPICTKPLAQSDAVCINCGYNALTGAKVATEHKVKAPKSSGQKCSKCGYALAGLRSARCPECGTINVAQDKREKYREDSKSLARWEYRKPILMFLSGASGVCAFQVATADDPGYAVLAYLISYVIEVPIGFAVFWLCGLVWIGFDAPIHLTVLRLAGIYAVVDLAFVLCAFIPFPFVGWLIPALLYVGFLSEMLDMDFIDAVVVGFLTFMTKLGIGIVVVMYLMGGL